MDLNHPKVCGHRAVVLDIQWNPFNDQQIASCSEDCNVMVWDIPEGGLTENLEVPSVTLVGHQRKCAHLQWHPTAANVLASSAYDNVIIIWDTSSGEQLKQLECFPDSISSFDWNYNGSLIAATCKDKKLRVINPRSASVEAEVVCHLGNKPSRVVFCGRLGYLCTTGFTKTAERQIAVWDKVGSHDCHMTTTCRVCSSSCPPGRRTTWTSPCARRTWTTQVGSSSPSTTKGPAWSTLQGRYAPWSLVLTEGARGGIVCVKGGVCV